VSASPGERLALTFLAGVLTGALALYAMIQVMSWPVPR
jgi:hypothetical protein